MLALFELCLEPLGRLLPTTFRRTDRVRLLLSLYQYVLIYNICCSNFLLVALHGFSPQLFNRRTTTDSDHLRVEWLES